MSWAAIVFLAVVVVLAVFADVLAPQSPYEGDLSQRLLPPRWLDDDGAPDAPLLGTDPYGRDLLSRLIHGAQVSLIVAALTVPLAAVVGTAVGLIAGYRRGLVDAVLMRIVDVGLSVPIMLIAIAMAALLGPSLGNVVLLISLLLWPRFARVVRGETLSLRERDYVKLARVAGCSHLRIVVRHLLPNLVPTILVLTTFQVGYVVVLEATLSFLGVGVPPPRPSWGLMVSEGRPMLASAWWISVLPGVLLALLVLSINMLGDRIRDVFDPHVQH
jgi:peptide/nickel transport system permease protein